MSKVIRSFKTRQKAREWVDQCRMRYPGKVTGGSTCARSDSSYWAQVWGDITQEMADSMKPASEKKSYFEYKKDGV